MATIIDFSASFPAADAIRDAGHTGVICYISPPRETWMQAKPLTKTVADGYKAAGLQVACVWQYGGADIPDVMRGAVGGDEDARAADLALRLAGLADWPVFFAVDFDITLDQWNATAVEYFRAAVTVLGSQRVGIYGHSRVVHWAMEDGVVADLGAGRCLGWVTSSWSAGDRGADYAVLYQGTHNVPGPSGVQVDINDTLNDQWGQAPIPAPKEPAVDVTNLPHVDETVWMNRHYTPGRWFDGRTRQVEYITRHHMGGIGDAHQCFQWWQTREATAHFAVDKTGRVGQLVREEDTAWSNADPASNAVSIAIEHSNCGGPDQDWPISDATITAGAHLAAELCLKHRLGRPVFGVNIRDHCEFGATGCPYHLRVGQKYHDQWMRAAQDHYDRLTSQEDDMTPEQSQKLDEIHHQLLHPWPQLGGRTLVDATAQAQSDIRLALDQLIGAARDEKGPLFTGWDADALRARIAEKLATGDGLTAVEQLQQGLDNLDKIQAALAGKK